MHGLRFSLHGKCNSSLSGDTGELCASRSELVGFSTETTEAPDYSVGGMVPYESPGSNVFVEQVNFITSYMYALVECMAQYQVSQGVLIVGVSCNLCVELPRVKVIGVVYYITVTYRILGNFLGEIASLSSRIALKPLKFSSLRLLVRSYPQNFV